jgi:CubicO group peptidase (beta-lactamase class C family)
MGWPESWWKFTFRRIIAKEAHPVLATPYFGYGYLFWLFPGEHLRCAMLGVYGQHLFVDPELGLVMVQTSAAAAASVAGISLGRERDAFWRGLVAHYGSW